MAKLVWRVKLVAERHPGVVTETELACIERDEDVGLADLGLRLDEAKRLAATLQAEMVPAQMAALSEYPRACGTCGRRLAAKGHYGATFRSLFGEVSVRVQRLFVCPCGGEGGAKSVAVLDFGADAVAPELSYVTARYAALVPFGKVAALLSELLPLDGAQHASTVRNRTLRVGAETVPAHAVEVPNQIATPAIGPVVVGLDGGYVRDRHRGEGRRFAVVAGKVIRDDGAQHRFAFVCDGRVPASEAFRQALAAAGGGVDTPVTVLCDGDAGLWQLQREVLPNATPVLDWWHAAVRFEHALQVARRLGAGTVEALLPTRRFAAWSGRSSACGTGTGRRAGAGSPPCAAGQGARACATWPARTGCNGRLRVCWATSGATRRRWCHMPLAANAAKRSRPHSWRAPCTRSSPGA